MTEWNETPNGDQTVRAWEYLANIVGNDLPDIVDQLDGLAHAGL